MISADTTGDETSRATKDRGWPWELPTASAGRCQALPETMPHGRPWPRISIVTPTRNQGAFIEETLLSVRNQGYPAAEHIIIDGGSTDATLAIIDRYRDGLAAVVSEPDHGQSDAINKGMRLATGEIVTWLNSDDMLAPGALAAVAFAFAQSGADMVAGICEVRRDGVVVGRHVTACQDGPLPLDDLLDLEGGWHAGQFFYQPEVFFRRDLWLRAGGRVADDLFYSMDYELWVRFAEQRARLHVVGRPLAWFRLHDEQKTSVEAGFKSELRVLREAYVARTGWRPSRPPRGSPDHARRLRFLFVNDFGWNYGAGIAHHRLATALVRAGHHVDAMSLPTVHRAAGEIETILSNQLVALIEEAAPDIVLLGNVHGAYLDPLKLVDIARRWTTLVVMHDFWWVTGRCVYMGDCPKYLSGCDHTCPTPDEHMVLAPELILPAWTDKRSMLATADGPVLLALSDWTAERARTALIGDATATIRIETPRVQQITLGLPTALFRPQNRQEARARLGLPQDRLIVLYTAFDVTDARKGGGQLSALARLVSDPTVLFLTVGKGDPTTLGLGADRLLTLPYQDDAAAMTALYSAADLVVVPSREETLGQIFMEAAACGTPAIGHGLTGTAETLMDGVTGLQTKAATSEGLAAALRALAEAPRLRADLGAWARIHAENNWSLEACYRSLFGLLERLGVVDAFNLARNLVFIDGDPGPVRDLNWHVVDWMPEEGFLPLEGPHAGALGTAFRWVVGRSASATIYARQAGLHRLIVECQNKIFPQLKVSITFGGKPVGHFTLPARNGEATDLLSADLALPEGKAAVTFEFDQSLSTTNPADPALVMMIAGIYLLPLHPVSPPA